MKTRSGFTHGRGLPGSDLAKSILTMIILVEVCNEMEDFCGVSFTTSEQHVDSREYRIKSDFHKLLTFFVKYDPFPETENIKSIFSGVIGGEKVNCYRAYEEGKKSFQSIIGNNFGSIKFQRKN